MTTTTALIAGLATSLHCAGMCGPLVCGLGTMAKNDGERMVAATLYHGTRLASYTIIGAVCGAIGQQPLQWFFDSPAVLLPWAMVLLLVLMAFGLDKKIPRPVFLARFTARLRFRAIRSSAYAGASLMGTFTPVLPCGPLYALFLAALLTGSATKGAESMLAFGLGTVPLLWITQHGFQRIRARLGPNAMARVQRALALVAALVLAWRLHDTIPLMAAEVESAASNPEAELPSCCH